MLRPLDEEPTLSAVFSAVKHYLSPYDDGRVGTQGAFALSLTLGTVGVIGV